MKIVDKFKSISNGSGSVEAIERVITEFELQRDAASAWLANFEQARRNPLLAEDAEALVALRAAKLEYEDKREAAEHALAQIRSRLVAARDAARAKRWGELRSKYDAAVRQYLDSAAIALNDFRSSIEVKTAVASEGFRNEILWLPSVPAPSDFFDQRN